MSPQITPIPIGTIRGAIHFEVQTKSAWSGSWVSRPYLTPVEAQTSVAPSTSSATIRYDFGTIKREDTAAFAAYAPVDLRGHYVRIRAIDEYGNHDLWVGIFTDDTYSILGSDDTTPEGTQSPNAHGLEHLLDSITIDQAWVDQGGEVSQIGRFPPFNRREGRGRQDAGNRSTDQSDDVYHFSDDGEAWTHGDILRYLLHYYELDTGPSFELGGVTDPLDDMVAAPWPAEGETLRQAVNHLIPRRRGFGWRLKVNAANASAPVVIDVFPLVGMAVSFGGVTVPANTRRYGIVLDDAIDVEEAVVTLSATTQYDEVIVTGEPVVTCTTLDYKGMNLLEKGWTDAEETAYKVGVDVAADYDVNDAERKTDKHARVYQYHKLDSQWAYDNATQQWVIPTFTDQA